MKPASLRNRLRWMIIVVIAAVLLPLGMLSLQRTMGEVDELSDGRLAQAARTLDVLIEHAGLDSLHGQHHRSLIVPIAVPHGNAFVVEGHTYESEVGFQIFDTAGKMTLATANLAGLSPPLAAENGFRDLRHWNHLWRVYTLTDRAQGVAIRAGERYDSRHEIMHALWLDHGLPLLFGLPLLGLLVGWAVQRGLRPLDLLTRQLTTREPGSRVPVNLEQPPRELLPVLDALNSQLMRLEDAVERERRFSADIAHELRTPLASTLINLESAMAAGDAAESGKSLVSAQQGIMLLTRRIEQLLALSRLEAGAASHKRTAVDLVAMAGDVVEELAPLIAEAGVELGFLPPATAMIVPGYEAALGALLRNLIENALRHVPAGGKVQLSIDQGAHAVQLNVVDDGPGISAERRTTVFARFHREASSRGDGYGLGLSIVQRAAELHGASIDLLDSPYGSGLWVRVVIQQ
jgi:two-component system sensor histidine kinase QseC